jgi:hypothetical protein
VKNYGDGGVEDTQKLVNEQRQAKFLVSGPSLIAIY